MQYNYRSQICIIDTFYMCILCFSFITVAQYDDSFVIKLNVRIGSKLLFPVLLYNFVSFSFCQNNIQRAEPITVLSYIIEISIYILVMSPSLLALNKMIKDDIFYLHKTIHYNSIKFLFYKNLTGLREQDTVTEELITLLT